MMKKKGILLSLIFCLCAVISAGLTAAFAVAQDPLVIAQDIVFLSDLEWDSYSVLSGEIAKDKTPGNAPIQISNDTYAKGLTGH